ncbi:MAG: O-antigen ligase family protein, partial [Phycisphaerae bacterium]|nr:O-antigen ligase family protein [Phycisphaerae bacterium]
MATKTLIFLVCFFAACGGALVAPLIGVMSYVLIYQISPHTQWWGMPIRYWGIRYSLAIAVSTGLGMIMGYRRLHPGKKILTSHERLLTLFIGLVWLSTLLWPMQAQVYSSDHPVFKMTKVLIFLLMLTHIVTTVKYVKILFWAFAFGVIFLGYQAYTANPHMFTTGRLNAIGGPDFRESNFLAAYLVACLPIIAVQFIMSGRIGKTVCLVAGVLTVNTIVLTRSRGAMVGLAAGAIVAVLAAPKRYRKTILVGLIIVAIGGYALTDPGYWKRAETITIKEGERGGSIEGRIDMWKASVEMLRDRPFGVGAGNFPSAIDDYAGGRKARDAHSTFVRCYGELGIQGIIVYLLLLFSAMRILWRVNKESKNLPKPDRDVLGWASHGVGVGLIVFMACGLTMTQLYVEGPWWFLAMPVCLARAL